MLRIEKALQNARGLQAELADIGVDVRLCDPVADDIVAAIYITGLTEESDQHILPDGGFYDGFEQQAVTFEEYRLRVIERLAQYYEGEAKSVADKWKELCGGEDTPLPDNLQARRKSLADTADKLHVLIKNEPPALNGNDYRLLEGIARDPQAHVTLPDGDYKRLKDMGAGDTRLPVPRHRSMRRADRTGRKGHGTIREGECELIFQETHWTSDRNWRRKPLLLRLG